MRRQLLLRTSSHSICQFCACRLGPSSTFNYPFVRSRSQQQRGFRISLVAKQTAGNTTGSDRNVPDGSFTAEEPQWNQPQLSPEEQARAILSAQRVARLAKESQEREAKERAKESQEREAREQKIAQLARQQEAKERAEKWREREVREVQRAKHFGSIRSTLESTDNVPTQETRRNAVSGKRLGNPPIHKNPSTAKVNHSNKHQDDLDESEEVFKSFSPTKGVVRKIRQEDRNAAPASTSAEISPPGQRDAQRIAIIEHRRKDGFDVNVNKAPTSPKPEQSLGSKATKSGASKETEKKVALPPWMKPSSTVTKPPADQDEPAWGSNNSLSISEDVQEENFGESEARAALKDAKIAGALGVSQTLPDVPYDTIEESASENESKATLQRLNNIAERPESRDSKHHSEGALAMSPSKSPTKSVVDEHTVRQKPTHPSVERQSEIQTTPLVEIPSKPQTFAAPVPSVQQVPSSALSDEEERLFQQMLARRSGRPLTSPQATATPVVNPITSDETQPNETPEPPDFSELSEAETRERDFLIAKRRDADAERKRREADPERKRREEELNQRDQQRGNLKIRFTNRYFDDKDKATPATPFDPALTAQWDIFKSAPKPKDTETDRTSVPRTSGRTSPEDIDAKFEEHRRQRAAPKLPFDVGNVPYVPLLRRPRLPLEQTMCARCGQLGHLARDCKPRSEMRRGSMDEDSPFGNDNTRKSFGLREKSQASPSFHRFLPTRPNGDEEDDADIRNARDHLRSRNQGHEHFAERPVRNFTNRQGTENDEDTEPVERTLRSKKFADEPARDTGRDRPRQVRRGRDDDEDMDERPRRGRRNVEEDEDEDDDRRGRRGRFEDEEDLEEDYGALREAREARKQARLLKKKKAAREAEKRAARTARKADGMTQIQLPEFVSVQRLAQTLDVKLEDFTRKMEALGFSNTAYDHVLSAENASLIAMEYNFDASFGDKAEEEERDLKARPEADDKDFLPARPPVVAIMGHVDHGKTTLLDYLRKSSIAASEHGGITQHIGAFSVGLSSGKTITFLDTPGHAAFLAMRQRGAHITDIVILVVAADDSVKPQTLEALKHARDANVPIIVAVSKVDKEEANIDRVKQDLARHGIEIEDFGGDTQVIPVSGKTGQGMEDLEEATSTLSEILDHRAETDGPVEGWVIEATTKRAGRVATVLVKRGTLKVGDIVVAGQTWARVRTLHDEAGQTVMSAGPGTPVEVDGWRYQPTAGDEVLQAPNEQKAVDVVEYRAELEERSKMAEDIEAINELRRLDQERREREKAAEEAAKAAKYASREETNGAEPKAREQSDPDAQPSHQTIPFIVKADVSGSVEAVVAYLLQMSNSLCSPTLLRSGVGPVSEFDIEHAATANGHIIAFNLPADPGSVGQAERRGVKVLEQNVIYRIVGDVKAVLEDKLPPLKTTRVTGDAEVAMGFEIGIGGRRKIKIAGCRVRNGVVTRGSKVRVLRDGVKVYDGVVTSLKNVKKDVQEMRKGTECGIGFEKWEGFEERDQIQTYEEKFEKRTLQV